MPSDDLWFRVRQRAFLRLMRLVRGMTLGVRVLVLDGEKRLLMVRHTYVGGWHMPGGGVDPGECLRDAAIREVHEETGLRLEGEPSLFGIYRNARADPRDHVAVFVCRETWDAPVLAPESREIAEAAWFARSALPDDTTGATRARLAEILDGRAPPVDW